MNKMLVMDLDGTALGAHGRMTEATRGVLVGLKRQGVVVAFATGRRQFDMDHVREIYPCADYVIQNSGSIIEDAESGEYIYQLKADCESSKLLLEACLSEDLQLYVIADSKLYINKMTPGAQEYFDELGIEPLFYTDPSDFDLEAIDGFMSSSDRERIRELAEALPLKLDRVYSEPGVYDYVPTGCNKWNAIEYLAKRHGLTPEEIVTVGNWYNDIDMISAAGTGIAVADAVEELKIVADCVTSHGHDEDAIVEVVINHF